MNFWKPSGLKPGLDPHTAKFYPPADSVLKQAAPSTSHLSKFLEERHLQPIIFVFVQPTPHSVNVYA